MIEGVPAALKIALPSFKGAIMAGVLIAADVPFIKALIIAAVSALLSGSFLVFATIYTVKHTKAMESKMEDVKRAVGASRREQDGQ